MDANTILTTLFTDLQKIAYKQETTYNKEDIQTFKDCMANKSILDKIYSLLGGALIGAYFPFKQTSTPMPLKRTVTGLLSAFTGLYINHIFHANKCAFEFVQMMQIKLPNYIRKDEFGQHVMPSDDEVSDFKPYEMTDVSTSQDFWNMDSNSQQDNKYDADNMDMKKHVTYEELRQMHRSQPAKRYGEVYKQNTNEHTTQPPPPKITNKYGDVME